MYQSCSRTGARTLWGIKEHRHSPFFLCRELVLIVDQISITACRNIVLLPGKRDCTGKEQHLKHTFRIRKTLFLWLSNTCQCIVHLHFNSRCDGAGDVALILGMFHEGLCKKWWLTSVINNHVGIIVKGSFLDHIGYALLYKAKERTVCIVYCDTTTCLELSQQNLFCGIVVAGSCSGNLSTTRVKTNELMHHIVGKGHKQPIWRFMLEKRCMYRGRGMKSKPFEFHHFKEILIYKVLGRSKVYIEWKFIVRSF